MMLLCKNPIYATARYQVYDTATPRFVAGIPLDALASANLERERRFCAAIQWRMNPNFTHNFAKVTLEVGADNQPYLLQERILNADGSFALPLPQSQTPLDEPFIEEMHNIFDLLKVWRMPAFDIRPEDILIQDQGEGTLRPVLASYAGFGYDLHPAQPWLRIKAIADWKLDKSCKQLGEYARHC